LPRRKNRFTASPTLLCRDGSKEISVEFMEQIVFFRAGLNPTQHRWPWMRMIIVEENKVWNNRLACRPLRVVLAIRCNTPLQSLPLPLAHPSDLFLEVSDLQPGTSK